MVSVATIVCAYRWGIIYALLFWLFLSLLNRRIQAGPEPIEAETGSASLPDTFREVFRQSRASGR